MTLPRGIKSRYNGNMIYWALRLAATAQRPFLRNIRVEPHKDGGALITASDGHMIMLQHDPKAICSTVKYIPAFIPATAMTIPHDPEEKTRYVQLTSFDDIELITFKATGEKPDRVDLGIAHNLVADWPQHDFLKYVPSAEMFSQTELFTPLCLNAKYLRLIADLSVPGMEGHCATYFRKLSGTAAFITFPWRTSMVLVLGAMQYNTKSPLLTRPEWLKGIS